nr:PREDICTED: zinc finger CCHC domain-containing protein 8 homolog isoform X2 [Megachile rotundata]
MNSAITIEDIDEEVIDLDSSQDAINDTDNDQSECSIEKNSLSNNIAHGTNITNENIDNNKGTTKLETCIDLDIAKPLIKVMFRDENIARQYSKKITKFLGELVSSKIKNQENDNGLTLEIWDNDIDSCQSIEITTESEDSQDIICDTLFTVDTQPKIKDDFDVPTYGKKYENAFEKVQHKSDSPKKNDCSRKLMCFNCLENHNLRDCPNPRNQTNIDKNRKNFNMKNSRALRYHLEDDQKFGHLIPGQLSSNLRKALGLKSNELPKHIYRMRELGYPPGWLEEARLQHSGLSLFNSDGVPEDDPNDEPGEIIEGDRDQYDIRKIYDFPGFNVPPPPGTHDEESKSPSSRANSPSLSDLENMKKQLLVELQETNSQSNSDISSKSNSSNSVSKSDMPPPSNEVTPESNRIRTRTSCGSVKSVDLGTPVLQSTSPYSKLPSSEKFSKDICDVINFENLPNSTGKYKQMSGVLQKVRTKLAKLHE